MKYSTLRILPAAHCPQVNAFHFFTCGLTCSENCKLFTCTTSLLRLFIFQKMKIFLISNSENKSILPGTLMPRQTTQEQKCTMILAPSIALVQNYQLSIQYLRIFHYVSFRGERQTKIPPPIAFIY